MRAENLHIATSKFQRFLGTSSAGNADKFPEAKSLRPIGPGQLIIIAIAVKNERVNRGNTSFIRTEVEIADHFGHIDHNMIIFTFELK